MNECLEVPVVVPQLSLPTATSTSLSTSTTACWELDESLQKWKLSLSLSLPATTTTLSTTTSTQDLKSLSALTIVNDEIVQIGVTLTCNALASSPDILVLSQLRAGVTAPRLLYMRLSPFLQDSPVVRTALHVLDQGASVQVVLVHASGIIRQWKINMAQWTPVLHTPITTFNIAKLLSTAMAANSSNTKVTTAALATPSSVWLRRPATTIVAQQWLVLAWTPHLVAIHLITGEMHTWSSSITLERMKTRSSTLRSIYNTGLVLLSGGPFTNEAALQLQDMNPILALASTTLDTHSVTGQQQQQQHHHQKQHVVYSWHDDGTLRQWLLPSNPSGNQVTGSPNSVYEYALAAYLPVAMEGAELAAAPLTTNGQWTLALYATTSTQLHLIRANLDVNSKTMLAVSPAPVTAAAPSPMQKQEQQGLPTISTLHNTPSQATLVAWQWMSHAQLRTLWQGPGEVYTQWTWQLDTQQHTIDDTCFWNAAEEERALKLLNLARDATDVHTVDQRYLQYLLRPRKIRGTGTALPPTQAVIQQALLELTGRRSSALEEMPVTDSDAILGTATTKSTNAPVRAPSSIGVQILLALQVWQERLETARTARQTPANTHAMQAMATPRRTSTQTTAFATVPATAKTPRAIYESLQLHTAVPAGTASTWSEAAGTAHHASPSRRHSNDQQQLIKERQDCWKKLLRRIWELEQAYRSIVAVAWLPGGHADQAVVVRGATISVVARATRQPVLDGLQGLLNNTAVRLLHAVEDTEESANALFEVEEALMVDLYHGDFALHPTESLAAFCQHVKLLGEGTLWDVLQGQDSNSLLRALQDPHVSWEEHVRELQRLPFGYGLEGLNVLPYSDEEMDSGHDFSMQSPVVAAARDASRDLDNVHWRASTFHLCMRCFDSMRRLALGRYMVLANFGVREEIQRVALWSYMHSISLMMTSAQHVAMPLQSPMEMITPFWEDPRLDSTHSPPKKRPSLDSHFAFSLLEAVKDRTTVLDAYQMRVSRGSMDANSPHSILAWSILVTKAIFESLYGNEPTASGIDPTRLPELSVLQSSPVKEAMEHPRFAIWLLAPALAIKTDLMEIRRGAVAECLVSLAEHESEGRGSAMAERAFELLHFNEQEFEQGVSRILKLHSYMGRRPRFILKLLSLVERAVEISTNSYTDELAGLGSFSKLLSVYFSVAIQARKWTKAAKAATMHSDSTACWDHLKRLVRHMVDNGALNELVEYSCLTDEQLSAYRLEGVNLYGVAMETFADLAPKGFYVHALHSKEPLSDYQGALYALHCAHEEWKRAAQAMDLRYINARKALCTSNDAISPDDARRREKLAVQDLAFSAKACAMAMVRIQDESKKYLISGEPSYFVAFPVKLIEDSKGRPKRLLGSSPLGRPVVSSEDGEEDESLRRSDRFMRAVDLQLRSARAACLQVLHEYEKVGVGEATLFLTEPVSLETDQNLISELFKYGYYQAGLNLAKALRMTREEQFGGSDLVHDAVSHLACNFLIPLMLGKETFPKPSVEQLHDSLNSIAKSSSTVVPVLAKSIKSTDSVSYDIRQLAGEILRYVTIEYTSPMTPVAKEVVDCLLMDHGAGRLPEWLHNFMVRGTSIDNHTFPGLFAKRRQDNAAGFLGDPSFLLTKYTMAGLLEDGCRTVVETLAVAQHGSTVSNRIPEKGNIYWVPYTKIDLLHNLIGVMIQKGKFSEERLAVLEEANLEMVASLEKHFSNLDISLTGIRSARAL